MSLRIRENVTVAALRVRDPSLDRLRGLAIACMIVDHVVLVFSGPELLRMTVGRVAMPLFFLLAGHLVRRVSWRTYGLIVVGLALPLVVPWIDKPNVLVWYGGGAAALVLLRQLRLSPWLLVVPALVLSTNGFDPLRVGTGYDGLGLVALMAAGALIPRWGFAAGLRLPALLGQLGRFPLTVYVGHLLLLQGAALWFLA